MRSTDRLSSYLPLAQIHKVIEMKKISRTLRSRIALASCLILGANLFAGCSSDNKNASENESQTVSFMLDWTPNTNHTGVYVAEKLGYFKEAGVSVKVLPTAQAGAETSVENGVADIAFTTLSNVAAFNTQGAHLKMVFALTQKPIARWCSLASRRDIHTPKDFDGKTFVSFGSAEQTAVLKQMIKTAGGTGEFTTATAGTNTFNALTSGEGDFGGFYENWEGVESRLHGPALTCFISSDWGVPGNPDVLGFAVDEKWLEESSHQKALRAFIRGISRGYEYALAHPEEAGEILVEQTPTAHLDSALVQASMSDILEKGYWVNDDSRIPLGAADIASAQAYFDFLYQAGTYMDADGNDLSEAPRARELFTSDYLPSK